MFARMVGGVRSRIADGVRSRIDATKQRISDKFTLPDKYKGTVVEKWALYWKGLYIDYGEVFTGVVQTVRTQPIRTSVYAGVGTGLYYCAKKNPSPVDFMIQLRRDNCELVLVDPKCHNPQSAEYIKFVERNLNTGKIRFLDLGVVSLMYLADYDAALALYQATCEYTGTEYLTFKDRVIDVGFWGKWWNLQEKMNDYDIVEEEFRK